MTHEDAHEDVMMLFDMEEPEALLGEHPPRQARLNVVR